MRNTMYSSRTTKRGNRASLIGSIQTQKAPHTVTGSSGLAPDSCTWWAWPLTRLPPSIWHRRRRCKRSHGQTGLREGFPAPTHLERTEDRSHETEKMKKQQFNSLLFDPQPHKQRRPCCRWKWNERHKEGKWEMYNVEPRFPDSKTIILEFW